MWAILHQWLQAIRTAVLACLCLTLQLLLMASDELLEPRRAHVRVVDVVRQAIIARTLDTIVFPLPILVYGDECCSHRLLVLFDAAHSLALLDATEQVAEDEPYEDEECECDE